MLEHFIEALGRRPDCTSAVFLLPAQPAAYWWRRLRGAQLLALYPAGSRLLTVPESPAAAVTADSSRTRIFDCPLATPVVAVQLGVRGQGPTDHALPGRGGRRQAHPGGGDGPGDRVAVPRPELSGIESADAAILLRMPARTVL